MQDNAALCQSDECSQIETCKFSFNLSLYLIIFLFIAHPDEIDREKVVVKIKVNTKARSKPNKKQRLILTNPFTILEPQDQKIGEFYVVHDRRATDLEAPKL